MDIVLRTTGVFLALWLLTRALGKRELSEMTAFELVLLVMVGDLVQQGATQEDMSVTGAVIAISTVGMWVLAMSYIGFRWRRARSIIEGAPVIVVDHGHVVDRAIRYERVSTDELLESARSQGIEDLRTVRWGVLEPDGTFSFLLSNGPSPQQARRTSLGKTET
jgi:uncharacterized membrane protein YcaP (DUF421 family)